MKAISRLRLSGLSTSEIADAIGDKSRGHLVRAYEKFDRFPSKRTYTCIVEVAESRGITLLARDFLAGNDPCEPDAKPAPDQQEVA